VQDREDRILFARQQPGGVGAPQWRWWDPVTLKDPPDRRGADAVAELEQCPADPAHRKTTLVVVWP
jgi:hypothetical protein